MCGCVCARACLYCLFGCLLRGFLPELLIWFENKGMSSCLRACRFKSAAGSPASKFRRSCVTGRRRHERGWPRWAPRDSWSRHSTTVRSEFNQLRNCWAKGHPVLAEWMGPFAIEHATFSRLSITRLGPKIFALKSQCRRKTTQKQAVFCPHVLFGGWTPKPGHAFSSLAHCQACGKV